MTHLSSPSSLSSLLHAASCTAAGPFGPSVSVLSLLPPLHRATSCQLRSSCSAAGRATKVSAALMRAMMSSSSSLQPGTALQKRSFGKHDITLSVHILGLDLQNSPRFKLCRVDLLHVCVFVSVGCTL